MNVRAAHDDVGGPIVFESPHGLSRGSKPTVVGFDRPTVATSSGGIRRRACAPAQPTAPSRAGSASWSIRSSTSIQEIPRSAVPSISSCNSLGFRPRWFATCSKALASGEPDRRTSRSGTSGSDNSSEEATSSFENKGDGPRRCRSVTVRRPRGPRHASASCVPYSSATTTPTTACSPSRSPSTGSCAARIRRRAGHRRVAWPRFVVDAVDAHLRDFADLDEPSASLFAGEMGGVMSEGWFKRE